MHSCYDQLNSIKHKLKALAEDASQATNPLAVGCYVQRYHRLQREAEAIMDTMPQLPANRHAWYMSQPPS
jgi:hypothetical protein